MNHNPEITFISPVETPAWANLKPILTLFEESLPGINHGDILNRHYTVIAAAFLLSRPDLVSYFLKAMHIEYPLYGHHDAKYDQPDTMISTLVKGIRLALSRKKPGIIEFDIFAKQFENNQFVLSRANPDTAIASSVNSALSSLYFEDTHNPTSSIRIVNHRNKIFSLRQVLRGIITLNPHVLADGHPGSLLNILRYHDRRKSMIFEIGNGKKVLLLHTCNFDEPLHLDCSLVITDSDIISAVEKLLSQNPPRNEIIKKQDWTLYQDGCTDLDPERPVESSPILKRVHELLLDPNTKTISWCSQFLPDLEDLKIIEKRLKNNTLESITIYAPSVEIWPTLYKLAGGLFNAHQVRNLEKKYPNKFNIVYGKKYVHAKLLVINDERLIITSHNFNRNLVKARTSEIALEILHMQSNTKTGLEKFLQQIKQTTHSVN